MKFKSLEELKDGMWTRLANGEVYTCVISPGEDLFIDGRRRGLIDMGAEWFPPIPPGYRLATEEDRKGEKPDDAMFTDGSMPNWCGVEPGDWGVPFEYIVPIAKPEPKVYEVKDWLGIGHYCIGLERDFQPGDRVRVEKVEG